MAIVPPAPEFPPAPARPPDAPAPPLPPGFPPLPDDDPGDPEQDPTRNASAIVIERIDLIRSLHWLDRAEIAIFSEAGMPVLATTEIRRSSTPQRQQPTNVVAEGSTEVGDPPMTTTREPIRAATAPLRGSGNDGRAHQASTTGS